MIRKLVFFGLMAGFGISLAGCGESSSGPAKLPDPKDFKKPQPMIGGPKDGGNKGEKDKEN